MANKYFIGVLLACMLTGYAMYRGFHAVTLGLEKGVQALSSSQWDPLVDQVIAGYGGTRADLGEVIYLGEVIKGGFTDMGRVNQVFFCTKWPNQPYPMILSIQISSSVRSLPCHVYEDYFGLANRYLGYPNQVDRVADILGGSHFQDAYSPETRAYRLMDKRLTEIFNKYRIDAPLPETDIDTNDNGVNDDYEKDPDEVSAQDSLGSDTLDTDTIQGDIDLARVEDTQVE